MHTFEHQAMATQYLLSIAGEDGDYAEAASIQCFQRLDELEMKLSRFVADSDINRMNKLKAGEQMVLDFETWEVVKQAIEVQQWTGGTFDIGVAEHMNIYRAAKQGILNEFEMGKALQTAQEEKLQASLYLDPEKPLFYCVQEGMKFDLGGIGKGYALEQLREMLDEMDIHNYTLSAGESTVLVSGTPVHLPFWQFPIASAQEQKKLRLNDIVVSASGTFHQGNHIFDPRTGTNSAVSDFQRIWVASPNAAYSDAFSTGLFLLSVSEIEELVETIPEITWVAYSREGKLHFVNRNAVNFVD